MPLTLDDRMVTFLELVARGLVLRLPVGEAWVVTREHHMRSQLCTGRLNFAREDGYIEFGPAEDPALCPDAREWHLVGLTQVGWDAVHRGVAA